METVAAAALQIREASGAARSTEEALFVDRAGYEFLADSPRAGGSRRVAHAFKHTERVLLYSVTPGM